jgi:hypothetical protein
VAETDMHVNDLVGVSNTIELLIKTREELID